MPLETVGRVSDHLFVFGVSHTVIISFPCQQFCFEPIWKDLSLPNRRHRSAKDKVLISRSIRDGKPFLKTSSRCALYLTSGWSDTRRLGRAHLCGLRLFSKLQSKKNTWHHIRRLRNYLNPDFYTHLVQQFSELGWVFIAPSAGNQGQDKESAALLSRWVSCRLGWLHHTAHQRSSALYFH